ncbi:flagellar protein FlaG [Variovorax boronicumulans]|uniref:flagellar protein FlaG n=1 Tax=Variovorax TaxID=34072 RepID=UPI001117EEB0|nr:MULTISPECIES: flagellar protein FlaG [Variovorax]MDP9917875.1 flagellar protein FlaG [Variovorax boronicumulans]TSD61556.1 flagellar protein FlaG [Variovorax sp. KBS0712]
MSQPVPAASAVESPWLQQLLAGRTGGAAAAAAEATALRKAEAEVEEATPVQIEMAVKSVNASLESRSISLQFEVDRDTDKLIVKVVDRSNGEVIRQIPTEEVVRIAKVMDRQAGLLVSQQA